MRRSFVAALHVLSSVALLTPAIAVAQTVVKVGIINTYSGSEAQTGDMMDKGIKLYVKEHQKDLPPGVSVELVVRDDTGPNPEVAKRVAQELITREHVQFLAGVVWTPNAAAIAPLTAEAKVPFVIMNAAGVELTRMSPYIVRVSYTLPQLVTPLGTWAAQQGWKKGYTAVPDFGPGQESEAAFAKAFTAAGGQMVGSVRYPVVNPDFAPFFARAKDVNPDVMYIFCISGKQSTAIMKTMNDLGMRTAGVHPVSGIDLTTDEELPNMGDIALGVNSASNYSAAGDRPANKTFLAAWKRDYGDQLVPNPFSVQGWDGMAAIYDVVKATKGKFTGDEAMKILGNWKDPDSPRGPIAIDPETHDIVQNVYIRKVAKIDGRYVNAEFVTFPQVKDPRKAEHPAK
ncbi:MAG TPA: ABC transporter substrate-binding protein [Stellaceae bacterium]|jgi:branched-chain amino acid transport system substrate-binding protein|nr:ABC transporter substrate-binding protein [Stellaceae bacterium]